MKQYIKGHLPVYAHIGRNSPETLLEHSNLVMDFCEKLKCENGLEEALQKILDAIEFQDEPLEKVDKQLIKELFYDAIYLHDLGKINPAFQEKKMKHKIIENLGSATDSKHSLFSAILYLDIYSSKIDEQIEDEEKVLFMRYIMFVFSYIISRHHSSLEDLTVNSNVAEGYRNKLKGLAGELRGKSEYLSMYAGDFSKFTLNKFNRENMNGEEHLGIPVYILMRLLYSSMVACDFYATYTYQRDGEKPEFRYLDREDVDLLMKINEETEVMKAIRKYEKDPGFFPKDSINKLRSDIFLEAERQLNEQTNESIFYLEAPTGSGKTNTSINLALQLLKKSNGNLNKVIYVFPFNTLVEQTKDSFDKIFTPDLQEKYPMAIINSITPIVRIQEENNGLEDTGYNHADVDSKLKKRSYSVIDYKEEVLYRQMIQYPITFTSHVNLFNYLFSIGREANLPFVHLCNSVIILDEIQSYRNDRWIEIIRFLKQFSDLLNIKIIIMSATLPKLDRLLEEQESFYELLPNASKYFDHPLFKNRVEINYDFLQRKITDVEQVYELYREVEEKHGDRRMLIQFITKKTANEFFAYLSEKKLTQPVYLLTGDHHSYYRKQVIRRLKEVNPDTGEFVLSHVLVIATQVIEAGVDIDMDIGLKDIAVLDAEEQFMGRINRSCLRNDCHVYFFDKDNVKGVYKKDYRLQHDLHDIAYQQMLKEKDFSQFYEHVFDAMIKRRNEYNENNIRHFYKIIEYLQFTQIAEEMKLINQDSFQLFLAYTLELDSGEVIDGEEIWEQYKITLFDKDMDYSERKVRMSILSEKMSYFIYQLYGEPKTRDENIGNIYYVKNGLEYLQYDEHTGMMQFMEDAYLNVSEGMIL